MAESTKKPLTRAREAFCVALVGQGAALDQSKAYVAAYPKAAHWKPESVAVAASKLMAEPPVQARLAELRAHVAERAEISSADILKGFAELAFYDLGDLGEWDGEGHFWLRPSAELPRELRNAVKSVKHTKRIIPSGQKGEPIVEETVALDLYDRHSALQSMARVFGMFIERKQLSGPGDGPIPLLAGVAHLTDRQLAMLVRHLAGGGATSDQDRRDA